MRTQGENLTRVLPSDIMDTLLLIDPSDLIPVLEKGIELEKLDLSLDSESIMTQRRIRTSRVLLALLYARKLGV
jgi:hypothetical protein